MTPPEPSRSGKRAVAFFMDANHAWVNYAQLPGSTTAHQLHRVVYRGWRRHLERRQDQPERHHPGRLYHESDCLF